MNDGSCIRLRPQHANHVWAYDFVCERTHGGRPLKLLTVVDEYTHECPAIRVERRLSSHDVLWVLADLFLEYGIPEHIRSDNGPEFVAKAVRSWLAHLGVKTLFIEPGSPWENGYVESFNSKLRDEHLNGEIFYTLKEAQILTAGWRRLYNAPAAAQLARSAPAGPRDDRLAGLQAHRHRTPVPNAGAVYGTNIEGGPMKGVRPDVQARTARLHGRQLLGRPGPEGKLIGQPQIGRHAPGDRLGGGQRLVA